jgi:hypothetical protein
MEKHHEPPRGSEEEAEEIKTEMEMINREAPVRRLVLVVVTALLVFVALWYFSH